ncbi:MAG: helix-turn-helix domain-containing protein [Deltaproteobacteria bacterium]|jgi:excisionase family DNA binding protein|nr:helix-turn-helix domain-containing protein [Deltaproteobacteria bacterium]
MDLGELITTADAAILLGVGPSTVKRWADDNELPCVRTAGGHRRFLRGDVERFRGAREEDISEQWVRRLTHETDGYEIAGALLQLRAETGSWWQTSERLGGAVELLGIRWQRGELSILDEHQASERLTRGLNWCSQTILVPPSSPRCLLALADGDEHTLGLSLLEPIAREAGWRTWWAGRKTPAEELVKVIERRDVEMVAVSASAHSQDRRVLADFYDQLEAAAGDAVRVVLGGHGAWPEVRAPHHRLRRFSEFRQLLEELKAQANPLEQAG